MSNSILNSPSICPVSSPSNKPARNEVHSIRGSNISRDTSNHLETLYSSVPDGPDIKIDEGCKVVTYK